jgi:hypothetical protein
VYGAKRSASDVSISVISDAVLSCPASEITEIETSLADRFAPYTGADGSLEIPGSTLVACASA